jgi:hypothetical protein
LSLLWWFSVATLCVTVQCSSAGLRPDGWVYVCAAPHSLQGSQGDQQTYLAAVSCHEQCLGTTDRQSVVSGTARAHTRTAALADSCTQAPGQTLSQSESLSQRLQSLTSNGMSLNQHRGVCPQQHGVKTTQLQQPTTHNVHCCCLGARNPCQGNHPTTCTQQLEHPATHAHT